MHYFATDWNATATGFLVDLAAALQSGDGNILNNYFHKKYVFIPEDNPSTTGFQGKM